MIVGAALVVAGGLVWLAGKLGFRGMPGDIRYDSGNFSVYVPIVSCLVLSALLTGLVWLWQWIGRR